MLGQKFRHFSHFSEFSGSSSLYDFDIMRRKSPCIALRDIISIHITIRPCRMVIVDVPGYGVYVAITVKPRQRNVPPAMSLSSHSQTSLTTLLSFLNSHSSETFSQKDLQWLFQVPKLADVFNRIIRTSLEGNDCILGVDELGV